MPSRCRVLTLAVVLAFIVCAVARAADSRILYTADGEGHLEACQSCPGPTGLGSLPRRATAVHDLRSAGPLLLLDGGNSLFGDETVASQGQAIVAAYDALGYDAVNISYRDFVYGKPQTQTLFADSQVQAVSANLLDAASGEPIFHPYLVRPLGDKKIAVIGLTESPAGLTVLPRLKKQLSGVRIDSPDAALAKWLPKAKADADQVVLMFYGSPVALNAITADKRSQCAVILLGGVIPKLIPPNAPHVYGADIHGRELTVVTLGATPEAKQLAMDSAVARDPQMESLLARYKAPPVELPVVEVPPPATQAAAAPAPASQVAMGTELQPDNGAPPGPTKTSTTTSPPPASTPPTPMPPTPPPVPPKVVRRLAAHSDLKPQGLDGVGLKPEQVNESIDRGAAFLWNYLKTNDIAKEHTKLGGAPEHVLALLALVHSGALQKFPDFEPALRAYLTEKKDFSAMGTYQDGLLCMLIESYGDPIFFDEQRNAAQYLVDTQGVKGTWTYSTLLPDQAGGKGGPGNVLSVLGGNAPTGGRARVTRTLDWKIAKDGDNSCSQFAILGLHSTSRCNNPINDDTWTRNLEANTSRQLVDDGSWPYVDEKYSGYGSMTCAGICAIAIDRYELHQLPAEVDPRIERALGWLDDNFSVTANPHSTSYYYYYLYSLERVGRILDTEFIGKNEWYPLGAKALLGRQEADGRWIDPQAGTNDPRVPTSFALLFLTRATPKLQVVEKHGGPGILRAQVQSPPPPRIYVILDASGSMIEMMGNQQKFDIARNAVRTLIQGLPETTEVALRVYGNHKSALDQDCDSDTTLEIPMGPLDRKAFEAKLNTLRARGKTPLALSLTDAASELQTSEGNRATLLLLTDGGEDTMPRRNPVKACDELGKREGLTFHIVGFDINQADWGDQLRAMAEHGHGYYWPAAGADDLSAQVTAAIFGRPVGFSVLDAQDKLITQGRFGQPMNLPEGSYHLHTAYAGQEFDAPFGITTDTTTAVLFDATQVRTGGSPVAPKSVTNAPAEPVPTAPMPKFCTHCGNPLPAGAKFCPKCGQPVQR